MNKYTFFISLLGILFTTKAYTQVTIGSAEKSIDGALLQLKNIEGVTDESANADRGLLLPRIHLTDKRNLFPMFIKADGSIDIDYNSQSKKEYQDNMHIGLVVYNTNECLDSTNKDTGLFIWDGEKWMSLFETNEGEVYVDSRDPNNPEKYAVGHFGNAGTWMLENLRAKMYDPIRDNNEAIVNNLPANPSMAGSTILPLWCYPGTSNQADNTFYTEHPEYGLLYNWAAATNSKAGATGSGNVDNPNQLNEAGLSEALQKRRQGICPHGWHLPSDLEWKILENQIINYTNHYALMSDIDPSHTYSLPTPATQGQQPTNHGKAMKKGCSFINGQSYATKHNGFSAVLAGYSALEDIHMLDEIALFSSSSSYNGLKLWYRTMLRDTPFVYRMFGDNATRPVYMSVRCKKN